MDIRAKLRSRQGKIIYMVPPPLMLALYCLTKSHLDDFGTGHSSRDRLRSLPFDTLKIDRSFVTPLAAENDIMVRSLIYIGKELGMNIIAEGVETQVELDRLVALGYCQIQGYYFAKPMPLSELKNWLHDNQHRVIEMQSKQQA